MRFYDYARKMENGVPVLDSKGNCIKAYSEAHLPEFQTKYAAGADFFCAEDTLIPSIWGIVCKALVVGSRSALELLHFPRKSNLVEDVEHCTAVDKLFSPTKVPTGIKACMAEDEVLKIYNRSSLPKKLGLILSNGVGIIDKDYFENKDNDGEILFTFYNLKPWNITVKAGTRIGQGIFTKILKPEAGFTLKGAKRIGGFGSTNS